MEMISLLIGFAMALVSAVQTHPDMSPALRAKTLNTAADTARQALVLLANYKEPEAVKKESTTAPVPQVQNGTMGTMTPEATPPTSGNQTAAPAPFVRTGAISATLTAKKNELVVGQSRVEIATITFKNNTNETILVSGPGNENSYVAISENTIEGWTPRVEALYRGQRLSADTRGILAGEEGVIQFFLESAPPATGSFKMSFPSYRLTGLTTGDYITVGGFPIDIGAVEVK